MTAPRVSMVRKSRGRWAVVEAFGPRTTRTVFVGSESEAARVLNRLTFGKPSEQVEDEQREEARFEERHRDELIEAEIAAFNADDSKTHRSNPDSRQHYYARRPILAEHADYEIVGFSGVEAKWVA